MAHGVTLKSFSKTVTATNVAQPLVETAELNAGHEVYTPYIISLYTPSSNSNAIQVGDENIATDGGKSLAANVDWSLPVLPINGNEYVGFNLQEIYIYGTAGDTIRVTYYANVND